MDKYRILVISSYPPERSAGLAQDTMSALEGEGHTVDFFTMYKFAGQKEGQYNIFPEPKILRFRLLKKVFPFLKYIQPFILKAISLNNEKNPSIEKYGIRIPHIDESKPPVDNQILLAHLPNKTYDFIMIFVTERMMTAPSYHTIYTKYHVPIIFQCMDMIHLTGGCYFFGECTRYIEECGRCKVLDSKDDFDQTHTNYLCKKRIFNSIQYGLIGNLHQRRFFEMSTLHNIANFHTSTILIDENKFIPKDVLACRQKFGIPNKKKFVILARYAGEHLSRSKGYDHMVRIINILYSQLTDKQREESLLMLIGTKNRIYERKFHMDVLSYDTLSINDLILSYSAASVFISTSIDDAGPSMVNQSMMCGTPVVTFSIGTALQVTIEGVNGYIAKNFDDNDFADKLYKIILMSQKQYESLKRSSRKTAIELTSKKTVVKDIINAYKHTISLYSEKII